MYPVSNLWAAAIPVSHGVANRVEAWDTDGDYLIGTLPYTAGGVQDQWVSGARRTLSLTVTPTGYVKQMLRPGVELRPFSGINYGSGQPEMIPLGRFPVVDTTIGIRPDATISLSLQDRWQWVVLSPFITPRSSDVGVTVVAQIIRLLTETGQWAASQVTNLCTSTVKVTAQVWDTDRQQAIFDLATSIGAEVFIDRLGNPVIRPRLTAATPVATFAPGVRLKGMSVSTSAADVYNAVRGTSTLTDPAFIVPDYTARITDPKHPAFPGKGIPLRSYLLTSPLFTDPVQMKNSVQKVLSKISRQARQLTIDPTGPDPSLDASDTAQVLWPADGSAPYGLGGTTERGQISTVNHPLTLTDSWQIVTASSRSDEDYTP